MRFSLLSIFCFIGLSASAQFWQSKPKPVNLRTPLLADVPYYSPLVCPVTINVIGAGVQDHELQRGNYFLLMAENVVLAEAKHNMRFRIYNLASYNFSDLAALYVKENRFSEAKWYLLQSTTLSRQQDDTRHTLNNLLALANIKVLLGEITLAKLDLQEARTLAVEKNMQPDIAEIDKKITYLQTNKILAVKAEIRYDNAVEVALSKNGIN